MLIGKNPEEISHEQVVRSLQEAAKALDALLVLATEDQWNENYLYERRRELRLATCNLLDVLFEEGED